MVWLDAGSLDVQGINCMALAKKLKIRHLKSVVLNLYFPHEDDCTCDKPLDILPSFCSRHEFQEDCENACGFGSQTGRCKWRPLILDNLPSLLA